MVSTRWPHLPITRWLALVLLTTTAACRVESTPRTTATNTAHETLVTFTYHLGGHVVVMELPASSVEDPLRPASWRSPLSDGGRLYFQLATRPGHCPTRAAELDAVDKAISTHASNGHFTAVLSRGSTGIWLRTFAAYGVGVCLVCDANVTGTTTDRLQVMESWAEMLCAGVTMQPGGNDPSAR